MDFLIALSIVAVAGAWLTLRWVRAWRRQLDSRSRGTRCAGGCGGCGDVHDPPDRAGSGGCHDTDGCDTTTAIREHFNHASNRRPG